MNCQDFGYNEILIELHKKRRNVDVIIFNDFGN